MSRTLTDDDLAAIAALLGGKGSRAGGGRTLEPNPDLAHELREIRRTLANLEGIIARTILRKDSRTKQAKEAGVHRSTIWARERRERLRQMASGKL